MQKKYISLEILPPILQFHLNIFENNNENNTKNKVN